MKHSCRCKKCGRFRSHYSFWLNLFHFSNRCLRCYAQDILNKKLKGKYLLFGVPDYLTKVAHRIIEDDFIDTLKMKYNLK